MSQDPSMAGMLSELETIRAEIIKLNSAQPTTVTTAVVKPAAVVVSAVNNSQHDVWVPRMVVGVLGAFVLVWAGFYFAGSHQAADLWLAVLPSVAGIVAVAGRMLISTITGSLPTTTP